jgi:glucuronate isomerase
MKTFLDDNFLLHSQAAIELYHNYAASMPILDYHCHLSVKDIYENTLFQNLTQIWLNGDHYKWRAMRANGISEEKITGQASDWEKFEAWSNTVPFAIGNPLYHWTHLELKRYFGISDIRLSPETALEIYASAEKMLQSENYRVRPLLEKMNVKVLCTTDDPLDSLEYHQKLKKDSSFSIRILPAFRPDKSMNFSDIEAFNSWVNKLDDITDVQIKDFSTYVEALQARHDYFHFQGCRLSDHGLERPYAEKYSLEDLDRAFNQIRQQCALTSLQQDQLRTALMIEFGKMNAAKNWVMQLHLGAIRNNNSRMFKKLGPDTGFDSMGDLNIAQPLAKFLDWLDSIESLPKTIIYSINPKDNDVIATTIGNFQCGPIRGKLQLGSAWWFNDQQIGIENQLLTLANHGLLANFVGMLTDSRSFLSFPRHEYFRRILCNLLGEWVEKGKIPDDMKLLGEIVQNICYNNADHYFAL